VHDRARERVAAPRSPQCCSLLPSWSLRATEPFECIFERTFPLQRGARRARVLACRGELRQDVRHLLDRLQDTRAPSPPLPTVPPTVPPTVAGGQAVGEDTRAPPPPPPMRAPPPPPPMRTGRTSPPRPARTHKSPAPPAPARRPLTPPTAVRTTRMRRPQALCALVVRTGSATGPQRLRQVHGSIFRAEVADEADVKFADGEVCLPRLPVLLLQ
jgi:hypothetical protein